MGGSWGEMPLTRARRKRHFVFNSGDARKKEVALTFDDGPDPVITKALVDVLGDQRVAATFFMLGRNVERFPGTALLVADR